MFAIERWTLLKYYKLKFIIKFDEPAIDCIIFFCTLRFLELHFKLMLGHCRHLKICNKQKEHCKHYFYVHAYALFNCIVILYFWKWIIKNINTCPDWQKLTLLDCYNMVLTSAIVICNNENQNLIGCWCSSFYDSLRLICFQNLITIRKKSLKT